MVVLMLFLSSTLIWAVGDEASAGDEDDSCLLETALPPAVDGFRRLAHEDAWAQASSFQRRAASTGDYHSAVWIRDDGSGAIQLTLIRFGAPSRHGLATDASTDAELTNGFLAVQAVGAVVVVLLDRDDSLTLEQRAALLDATVSRMPEECAEGTDKSDLVITGWIALFGFLFGGLAFVRLRAVRNRPFLNSGAPKSQASVVDARAWDTNRRTKRINQSVLAWTAVLVGTLGAALSAAGESSWILLAGIFGAGLASAGSWWVGRAGHRELGPLPPTPPPVPGRHGWKRTLAAVLNVLTVAVLVGGALLLPRSLRTEAYSDLDLIYLAEDRGLTAEDLETQLNIERILPLLAVAFALVVAMLARQLSKRDRLTALRYDRRKPILLLRSFVDDNLQLRSTPSPRHGVLGRLWLRPFERFEEIVAWSASAYGPVVAVQDPRRRAPPLGAARESIVDDDWQSVVRQRIGESSLVLVVLGETADTSGFAAEIELLRTLQALDRVVFVLPPLPSPVLIRRWIQLAGLVGAEPVLPNRGFPVAAWLREDTTTFVLAVSPVRDVGYETGIDVSVAARSSSPEPQRVP